LTTLESRTSNLAFLFYDRTRVGPNQDKYVSCPSGPGSEGTKRYYWVKTVLYQTVYFPSSWNEPNQALGKYTRMHDLRSHPHPLYHVKNMPYFLGNYVGGGWDVLTIGYTITEPET
jgi:hypothetical protein